MQLWDRWPVEHMTELLETFTIVNRYDITRVLQGFHRDRAQSPSGVHWENFMTKQVPAPRRLPIEWFVPDDLETRYATNFVVLHTQTEFMLYFFEVVPPISLVTSTGGTQTFENVESVQAKAIARIVVSPSRMPEFMNALQENWSKFLDKLNAFEEEAEEEAGNNGTKHN
jgi:hypothetical protein